LELGLPVSSVSLQSEVKICPNPNITDIINIQQRQFLFLFNSACLHPCRILKKNAQIFKVST
jgi:hypothetical protein